MTDLNALRYTDEHEWIAADGDTVCVDHGVARPSGALALGDETDENRSVGCGIHRSLADEVLFVGHDDATEPGLRRLRLTGELVAVERHARFESKSVARCEAGGHESVLLSGFGECVPECRGIGDTHEQFEAVFAGVPGAGEEKRRPQEPVSYTHLTLPTIYSV